MHPLKNPDPQPPLHRLVSIYVLTHNGLVLILGQKRAGICSQFISSAKNTFNNTFHAYGSALVTF